MINDIIVRIKKDERKVWIIDVRPLLMIDVYWKKRKSDKQKHGSTVLINHYPTRLVESLLELELDQNCRSHPLENLEKKSGFQTEDKWYEDKPGKVEEKQQKYCVI